MDLHDLEYVIAIAKYQSLTKAAEALYISQPSLSNFLKKFEDELGLKIFDRMGKSFIVNYAGECLIREGQKMLHIRKNLEHQLTRLEHKQKARLIVGMVLTRAMVLMPLVLPIFSERYPYIEVVLVEEYSNKLVSLLNEGTIDVAVLNNPPPEFSNLNYHLLCRDETVLCASKKHPVCGLAQLKEGYTYPWLDLKHVQNDRFIITGQDPRLLPSFMVALSQADIQFANLMHISNTITAVRLTIVGYGLCYAFSDSVILADYGKEIQQFSINDERVGRNVVIAYRSDSIIPEYVTDFINILVENYPNKNIE